MKLFLVLGNQLFPLKYFNRLDEDYVFYMCEDYGLCTYQKHHKKKILLYLSSMRSLNEKLKENNFRTIYKSIEEDDFDLPYIEKLNKILSEKNITEIASFEIEDKFFENKIKRFAKNAKINWKVYQTPMFLNSREKFHNYLKKTNRPFMGTFYKQIRKEMNILIDDNNSPLGGKWSFDKENRKKLPKNINIPKFPIISTTNHTEYLKDIIENKFKDHPGATNNFWFATEHKEVEKIFNFFLKNKFHLFGDYEDTVSKRDNILFHSALSPYINLGLITPEYIIDKVLTFHKKNNINLNSLEGYIRQIIGWREFMRGIYQNYSKPLENGNFFKHSRGMKKSWYRGNTGLEPLDFAIKNALDHGWSHHIERLMILSNIMNLCEIKPKVIYKWFMEMYVDSSDWVMSPNVYGMGLFSDGGIFSTKPYICGSNYILKMMDFKKGEWCNILDGLYWRFIDKNRDFFLKNPRLNMMVRVLDSMNSERKELIFILAENFIQNNTLQK